MNDSLFSLYRENEKKLLEIYKETTKEYRNIDIFGSGDCYQLLQELNKRSGNRNGCKEGYFYIGDPDLLNHYLKKEKKELAIDLVLVLFKINELIVKMGKWGELFSTWHWINKFCTKLKCQKFDEYLGFYQLDYMITERCSLKCEDCLNLMQYYKHPKNDLIGAMSSTIDVLMRKTDIIAELRVLGGEPFMNPQIYEFCEECQSNVKISSIIIFTNATIPLQQDKLASLNKDKVFFYISDYKNEKQRVNDYEVILEEMGFQYYVNEAKTWIDNKGFDFHTVPLEEAEQLYECCEGRTCPVVKEDKLYVCEFLANAQTLQAIPDIPENYRKIEETISKKELKQYVMSSNILPGCYYCNRLFGKHREVSPGIQTKKPLDYTIFK